MEVSVEDDTGADSEPVKLFVYVVWVTGGG